MCLDVEFLYEDRMEADHGLHYTFDWRTWFDRGRLGFAAVAADLYTTRVAHCESKRHCSYPHPDKT